MNNDDGLNPYVILAMMILLIVVGAWTSFEAPCSWFKGTAIKDVPARCLEGFQK